MPRFRFDASRTAYRSPDIGGAPGTSSSTFSAVRKTESGLEGRLGISLRGEEVARITYKLSADKKKMIIEHTIVDREYRGSGLGLRLVKAAVADARATGRKIDPVCWYADRILSLKPEFADVLVASHR